MTSAGVRQVIRDVTFPLVLFILISTLGPLQFGYHLVGFLLTFCCSLITNGLSSLSSTHRKMSSPAKRRRWPSTLLHNPVPNSHNVSP